MSETDNYLPCRSDRKNYHFASMWCLENGQNTTGSNLWLPRQSAKVTMNSNTVVGDTGSLKFFDDDDEEQILSNCKIVDDRRVARTRETPRSFVLADGCDAAARRRAGRLCCGVGQRRREKTRSSADHCRDDRYLRGCRYNDRQRLSTSSPTPSGQASPADGVQRRRRSGMSVGSSTGNDGSSGISTRSSIIGLSYKSSVRRKTPLTRSSKPPVCNGTVSCRSSRPLRKRNTSSAVSVISTIGSTRSSVDSRPTSTGCTRSSTDNRRSVPISGSPTRLLTAGSKSTSTPSVTFNRFFPSLFIAIFVPWLLALPSPTDGCILLLNGWTPLTVAERAKLADIVAVGRARRTFKDSRSDDANTYHAEFDLVRPALKGQTALEKLATTTSNRVDGTRSVVTYNVSNFGDRHACYADVTVGDEYVLFLTIFDGRLSAKYDDLFGAVTERTRETEDEIFEAIGECCGMRPIFGL